MKGSLVFFKMFSSWQLFCSSAGTISQLSVLAENYSAWFYLWGNSLQATNMTNLCVLPSKSRLWMCSNTEFSFLGLCIVLFNQYCWLQFPWRLYSYYNSTVTWYDPKKVIKKKKVKLNFIWILKIAYLMSGGSEIPTFWEPKEKFDSGAVEVVEMQRIPFSARWKSYWYMLHFVPEMFGNWWRLMTNL